MHPIPDIGGFRGICNGFSVRIIVYCWKYFWWKLQCIVGKAVVVLGRIQCISSKNYFVLFEVFLVETMIWRDHVSIMAHNRRRGWQHFEKITGEAIAETVIFQNFTLGADYERHNWKHYLARICFMSYGIPTFVSSLEMIENFGIHWEGSSRLFDLCGGPSVGLEIFGKNWNFCFFFGNVDDFENLEILENYNFQRRRPIMTLGGVYWWKLQCIPFQGVVVFEENAMHFWSKLLCIVGKISCANCNATLARQWWFWAVFCIRAPQPAPAIAALTFSNISIDFQTQHLLIWSNPWFP